MLSVNSKIACESTYRQEFEMRMCERYMGLPHYPVSTICISKYENIVDL